MKILLKRFDLNGHTTGFRLIPCESNAEEVSFERSHHRISFIDSKVTCRTTLKHSTIFSESERG